MRMLSFDAERLAALLALRSRIEWDWPDGTGRDVALRATDDALRGETDQHARDAEARSDGPRLAWELGSLT